MALSCLVTVSAATDVDTTKKGSIKLTKYDSATVQKDENDKVTSGTPVQGATFSAYRILDFDNGKTYTVDSNFIDSEGNNVVEVDDIVNVSASKAGTLSYGSTDKLEAQITKLQNYIQTNNIAATATATTNENGVATIGADESSDDNKPLPLGVYLVQETVVPVGYTVTTQAFLVAIPQWNQDTETWQYEITATPKDELLQVDKQMKDENQGTTDGTKDDSYSIGDTIPYTVTAKIPNYGMSYDDPTIRLTDNLLIDNDNGDETAKIAKYNALNVKFTDTLTNGLTLDLDSLVIKVLDTNTEDPKNTVLTKGATLAELESFTYTDGILTKTPKTGENVGSYTATTTETDGSTTMTIDIAWASLDQYQGKTIQLTYNAQLNENAVVGSANQNDVTYEFTNDPQQVMENPKTTTTDTDKVYTYQMDLTKKFNGAPADGTVIDASTVEFELYVKKTDGGDVAVENQKMSFINNSDGNYTVWTDETAPTDKTLVLTLNPNSTGSLTVKGLEAGTYELKETKSLNGYTILTEPITIKVDEVKEGNPEAVTQKVTAHTMKWNETELKAVEKDELAKDATNGIFTIIVNNAKNQFNLPITGGLGLWMFTIGGGIVMAGAIIFFSVIRKKKSNKV